MNELISKIDPGHLIAFTAVLGAFSCGIIAIVMGIRLEIRRIELASALKQDMLDRGMTAEEIRMVMDAGSKKTRKLGKAPMMAEV